MGVGSSYKVLYWQVSYRRGRVKLAIGQYSVERAVPVTSRRLQAGDEGSRAGLGVGRTNGVAARVTATMYNVQPQE